MTGLDVVLIASGLALLLVGGELLVRGAATAAERLGLSPLLIGLTLVGLGTSMPELMTSVQASLVGSPGIAVGNVVGSNIANVFLILGVAITITPIAVNRVALVRGGSVVLATAFMFCGVALFLTLDRVVGAVFLSGLIGYVFYCYRQELADIEAAGHTAAFEKHQAHEELPGARKPEAAGAPASAGRTGLVGALPALAIATGGLVMVLLGAKLLVEGAISLAVHMGVSDALIGLTLVAIGTSLPELATTVIAALRRHGDVALGNVLGSNIYNILGIAGVTGLIAPTSIPPEIARFDVFVMLAASIALIVFARTGNRFGRGEGAIFLVCYVAYIAVIAPI